MPGTSNLGEPSDVLTRVRSGDRRALARAITAVENDHDGAAELLSEFHRHSGTARRIGVTGAPGAGKSTLVSELITTIRTTDQTVAVMAVDPSSPFTGGAILGDRIRMQDHIGDAGVYIRSIGSRGHVGGMSAAAPKVAALLDGAGFDVVVIETVGVGQAEVEVVAEADSTVVVVTPGWGDSVQANKAGLLEIGDVFVVNKADRPGADEAVRDLEAMLDLGATRPWRPPIVRTVAIEPSGVDEVWKALERHATHLAEGELDARRRRRSVEEMERAVQGLLLARVAGDERLRYGELLSQVEAGTLDPWTAAHRIVSGLD